MLRVFMDGMKVDGWHVRTEEQDKQRDVNHKEIIKKKTLKSCKRNKEYL